MTPARTGQPGRPAPPYKVAPAGLQYATVPKTREDNRVVAVAARLIDGTKKGLKEALPASAGSGTVHTGFGERHRGTDRNRKARKVRKTYCFSKGGEVHGAMTYFSYSSYTFCGPVRALRERNAPGKGGQRTPAMAAGLADHIWAMKEWLTLPSVVQR